MMSELILAEQVSDAFIFFVIGPIMMAIGGFMLALAIKNWDWFFELVRESNRSFSLMSRNGQRVILFVIGGVVFAMGLGALVGGGILGY